jgi:hypothetical protein
MVIIGQHRSPYNLKLLTAALRAAGASFENAYEACRAVQIEEDEFLKRTSRLTLCVQALRSNCDQAHLRTHRAAESALAAIETVVRQLISYHGHPQRRSTAIRWAQYDLLKELPYLLTEFFKLYLGR